jgi:hypothetical protein
MLQRDLLSASSFRGLRRRRDPDARKYRDRPEHQIENYGDKIVAAIASSVHPASCAKLIGATGKTIAFASALSGK